LRVPCVVGEGGVCCPRDSSLFPHKNSLPLALDLSLTKGQPLVTTTVNGIATRSVEHPEHGPLIMAADLVKGLGYPAQNAVRTLNEAGVPSMERIKLLGSGLLDGKSIRGAAIFITRKGVNLVLMFSGKPIAQETRQWLAGDVMPAIADTGGYLLNEAAQTDAHQPNWWGSREASSRHGARAATRPSRSSPS